MERAEQRSRAEAFRALHAGPGILVLPNAWDVISALVMEEAGFRAVATTSGGCAHSLGFADGEHIDRDAMADVVRRMANALSVPLSADMEAGYGPAPDDVAATVRAAIEAGAVGVNIEDKSGGRLLPLDQAVERIRAACEAAEAAGVPALINARTDCFQGVPPEEALDEGIERLNAYLAAGAGCAFAIFVRDGETIGRLAEAVEGPLNILPGPDSPSVAELEALGVRRVTLGGAIARAALTAARKAVEELRGSGTYESLRGTYSQPQLHALLSRRGGAG